MSACDRADGRCSDPGRAGHDDERCRRVAAGDAFEARRLGLDHVAFGVPDRAALEQWEKRLDELGIAHGDIVDAHYGSGLSFRDPDGIALEFFAPPA